MQFIRSRTKRHEPLPLVTYSVTAVCVNTSPFFQLTSTQSLLSTHHHPLTSPCCQHPTPFPLTQIMLSKPSPLPSQCCQHTTLFHWLSTQSMLSSPHFFSTCHLPNAVNTPILFHLSSTQSMLSKPPSLSTCHLPSQSPNTPPFSTCHLPSQCCQHPTIFHLST